MLQINETKVVVQVDSAREPEWTSGTHQNRDRTDPFRTSELMNSTDVDKASCFQKVFVMFIRLRNLSALAHHYAMGTYFELKSISERKQKSELVLPFVTLELG